MNATNLYAGIFGIVCPPRTPAANSTTDGQISTSWQHRLLIKRGANLYQGSMERADRCAIAILDAQGIVIAWHDYLPNARSYDHRVVSRHVSQFYLAEDVALALPAHHLSIAHSQGVDRHLGWRRRPSSEIFWGMTVIQTLFLNDGALLGYSHVTRYLRGNEMSMPAIAPRMMPSPAASCAFA